MSSKISALPAASALDGTEPFPLVQGGSTKKGLISDIRTFFKASAANAKDRADASHFLTPANLLDIGVMQALWKLAGADMNSTADQAFSKVGSFNSYMIVGNGSIRGIWKSGATSSVAVGGIYNATSKGGDVLVSASAAWSGLSGARSGSVNNPTSASGGGNAYGAGERTDSALYLSLTTGAGSAQTADIYIFGIPLS